MTGRLFVDELIDAWKTKEIEYNTIFNSRKQKKCNKLKVILVYCKAQLEIMFTLSC